jgi:hypothetical protein
MSTPSTEAVVPQRPKPSIGTLVAGWVGLAGHLATLVWYAASGLMAPGWAVIGLLVIWLALLALAIYLLRTRPVWVLAVPVLATAVWFGVMSAGDAWLGWTA